MTDKEMKRLYYLHNKNHWTLDELYELDLLYKEFYVERNERTLRKIGASSKSSHIKRLLYDTVAGKVGK